MYDNPVTEALEAYYATQYISDEDYAVMADYGIPIAERKSGIIARVEGMLAEGVDLNNAPDGEYPLMTAVINLDAVMVRHLLQHGADCRKWLAEGEEQEWDERNWYLEELDVRGLNNGSAMTPDSALQKALFETVCELVIVGGLHEPFHSYCVDISEDGVIEVGWMKAKF